MRHRVCSEKHEWGIRVNYFKLYEILAAEASDDIDILIALFPPTAKIFSINHFPYTLDSNLKFMVPFKSEFLGNIVYGLEKKLKSDANSFEEFCTWFSDIKGPMLAPLPALSALTSLVPFEIIHPKVTINEEAFYTTYFISAINENYNLLRKRIELG